MNHYQKSAKEAVFCFSLFQPVQFGAVLGVYDGYSVRSWILSEARNVLSKIILKVSFVNTRAGAIKNLLC